MPEDLASALTTDDGARDAFSGLSYSHRREYVEWTTGAKRADTGARRVAEALERLRTGRTAR